MNTPSTSLEIKDLALVRAIAEAGGVSKAGQALHLSQSAVSHHLTRLEQRLGCQLFHRKGRRLELNSAGAQLVELAREFTQRLNNVERALRAQGARRKLRLSTECYTTYHWLPDVLDRFSAKHPNVELAIAIEATREPLRALEQDQIDLAICHSKPSRGWVSRPLFQDGTVLVVAHDHPLARRKRVRAKDLAEYTLYVYDLPKAQLISWGARIFSEDEAPARLVRVPLTEAIIGLVKSKRGVSILSEWVARPYAEEGQIKIVPLVGHELLRQWRAVYAKHNPLAPQIEALIEALEASSPMAR